MPVTLKPDVTLSVGQFHGVGRTRRTLSRDDALLRRAAGQQCLAQLCPSRSATKINYNLYFLSALSETML